MYDKLNLPIIMLLSVIFCAVFGIGVAAVVGLADYYVFSSNPVTVLVDDYVVYDGPRACVELDSTGLATRVDVKKPPFCLRTIATYSTSSVIVKPQESRGKTPLR